MITIDDVVGLKQQQKIFKDVLILPNEQKENYDKLVLAPDKVKRRKNFLLYGPSGSGKTFLVHALANTLDLSFTSIGATQLLQELHGRGSRMLRDLYNDNKGGVIFIDEADAIARDRTINKASLSYDVLLQLMLCMDGIGANYDTTTILATNKKVVFDDGLLSRIPLRHQLSFPHPDSSQRELIIKKQLSYHNNRVKDVSSLVKLSEGFDGRQLEDVFAYARTNALNNNHDYLSEGDFHETNPIA